MEVYLCEKWIIPEFKESIPDRDFLFVPGRGIFGYELQDGKFKTTGYFSEDSNILQRVQRVMDTHHSNLYSEPFQISEEQVQLLMASAVKLDCARKEHETRLKELVSPFLCN